MKVVITGLPDGVLIRRYATGVQKPLVLTGGKPLIRGHKIRKNNILRNKKRE